MARHRNGSGRIRIEGHVNPGFEPVRDAFAENFSLRGELGGACCVYLRGEKVVDLWGGVRNKATGEPWQEDTMVLVHSATKGLAAMTLAVAHSRGWLDYEERVSAYWPEFAQQGKEAITVRQLLAHQAGLHVLDERLDRDAIADLDLLAVVLARQKPAWEPGTRQAYHAITLGYYEGELLRRIDPRHRSLGQFFQDEIATPLGLDFYIRLPEYIPNARLATLARPGMLEVMRGFGLRFSLVAFNPRSNIVRALIGSELPHDEQRVYARNFEIPSGGGVGTAHAIAHAYSVFATGGQELELRAETLRALEAPAVPPARGFYDECMMGDGVQFSLGFMKHGPIWTFGTEGAYGSPGSGGSLGFADPKTGIGYGYVTNQMGTSLTGDPRELALRNAVTACARSARRPVYVCPISAPGNASLPSYGQGSALQGMAGSRGRMTMNETHCVAIGSSRHGNGFVCFFDEPFGEGTPFEAAGGYLIRFDSGHNESGPISMEDLTIGLDAWLTKMGWQRTEVIDIR